MSDLGPPFAFKHGTPCTAGACTGTTYIDSGWEPDWRYGYREAYKRLWKCTGGHWCWQYLRM